MWIKIDIYFFILFEEIYEEQKKIKRRRHERIEEIKASEAIKECFESLENYLENYFKILIFYKIKI